MRPSPQSNFRMSQQPQKKPRTSSVTPSPFIPTAPGNTFSSVDSPVLGSSHQWNHTMNHSMNELWFSVTHSASCFRVHPCCSLYEKFTPFLWSNNIPFYGSTTFSLSIQQLIDIWLLAVLNNVMMNVHVQVSEWVCGFTSLVCIHTSEWNCWVT